METEQIYTLIASLLPSLTAIATTIATLVTMYKKVKGTLDTSNKDIKNLAKELTALAKENEELKKTIRLKIDKIAAVDEIKEK